MTKYVPVRLSEEEAELLEEEARREKLRKSVLARKLIVESLHRKRIDRAIEEYIEGKCSLGYAAKMAKLDIREFIARLISKGHMIKYEMEEYLEDLKAVEGIGD